LMVWGWAGSCASEQRRRDEENTMTGGRGEGRRSILCAVEKEE
jgi:hypothetical protein